MTVLDSQIFSDFYLLWNQIHRVKQTGFLKNAKSKGRYS